MIKYARNDGSKVYIEYMQKKNLLKVKFYNLDSMFEQDGIILSNILVVYHNMFFFRFFDHTITMCLSVKYPTIKNNLIFEMTFTESEILECLKNGESLNRIVDRIRCNNTHVSKPKCNQIKRYIGEKLMQYLIKSIYDFSEIKCIYRGL